MESPINVVSVEPARGNAALENRKPFETTKPFKNIRPHTTQPWEVINIWIVVCLRLAPGSTLSFGGPEGVFESYTKFCFDYGFTALPRNYLSILFDPILMAGNLPDDMSRKSTK